MKKISAVFRFDHVPLKINNGGISQISADPSKTNINMGYYGLNQLISDVPAYDTHRLTFF